MADFEEVRQRIFELKAAELLRRLDPETGLMKTEKRFDYGAHSKASGFHIVETSEAAVAFAMTGRMQQALKAVIGVLDRQDRNPASFTCGNFFWHSGWKTVGDPNAVSFIVPRLCYLLKHRADAMGEDVCRRIMDALSLAVDALNAHRATWQYTNIALLNIAEEWRNHTSRWGGITEFNSLAYTETQIHALAMMLTCRADESFLKEVRMVLRHMITSVVLDFHPEIGRITGPQSRAYVNDRRWRGRSAMDTVLHFVLGTPEPEIWSMWLGSPIGPEDLLSAGKNLKLPRTTRARTQRFERTNYLAADFALGSVSGRGYCNAETSFFLAYRSSSPRCTIVFFQGGKNVPDAHYSCQREGVLLAASVYLLKSSRGENSRKDAWWEGRFSGLNTGRPENVVREADFRPGYTVELGTAENIRIFDGEETPVKCFSGNLPGTALAIETESICVGMRFFGSDSGRPTLNLQEEKDGEIVLKVKCTREGLTVSELETAAFCGFLLRVISRCEGAEAASLAREMAGSGVAVQKEKDQWHLRAGAAGQGELELQVPAKPTCFYSVDGKPLTANQWALSLGGESAAIQ